ncbi:uncharacterized protein PFL1_04971 [Pseudozyma flocculosa PF-1]|uniref:Uncharacterized protein n=2 Tax=Pseudozyma flocculosa TaxID=84751 RepID=A0A5C3EV27_9BASI|nr:uncharacterized protein PFL1_04971 [Pseudozyma flocculosa PF-1]EPQ27433.1 hypothetical protein PFL1_04971 [Pseudozyma flocculosa PF-1]SPO36138.1 uncharacterized protein PSFLO_01609 [Pseudozyma flocculosa]
MAGDLYGVDKSAVDDLKARTFDAGEPVDAADAENREMKAYKKTEGRGRRITERQRGHIVFLKRRQPKLSGPQIREQLPEPVANQEIQRILPYAGIDTNDGRRSPSTAATASGCRSKRSKGPASAA